MTSRCRHVNVPAKRLSSDGLALPASAYLGQGSSNVGQRMQAVNRLFLTAALQNGLAHRRRQARGQVRQDLVVGAAKVHLFAERLRPVEAGVPVHFDLVVVG